MAGGEEKPLSQKISEYFVNDGPKAVCIVIWLLANIAVFSERYIHYAGEPKVEGQVRVFDVFGHGVSMARGAAAAIKLNCALLLMTVLRNFLSWLRSTWVGNFLPIDKNIVFHRYLAWSIAFFAGVHIVAHYFNYNRLYHTTDLARLGLLGMTEPPSPYGLGFTTLPGTTGHILTLIMVLMYTSAIRKVRGPQFNVFWFTHHLFIFFFGLLCIHGAAAILEKPTFWMWFIGPGFLYALERTIRILRGNQDTILLLAVAHPSKVLELQLKKSSFKYQSGQEWHPFTITSAPEEDFVSVHIRIVGDWTGDVWNFLNPEKKLGIVRENLMSAPDGSPIFKIDGPFGSASEEVFDFKTVMLVGGGIGVTPFASILKHIRFSYEKQGTTKIQKAYFYWISRDKNAFEWFSDLLSELEATNISDYLEIHTYLTGQLSADEIRNVMYGLESGSDQITGLQSPTHFGRPNWKEIFEDMSKKHDKVGVFFCGPAILSKQLYKMSRRFTSNGKKFIYHKENF